MKGAFRKETDFAVTVCGSLTSNYEEANERVATFRDSFERIEMDNIETDGGTSNEPSLLEIRSIKLHNPEHQEDERIYNDKKRDDKIHDSTGSTSVIARVLRLPNVINNSLYHYHS